MHHQEIFIIFQQVASYFSTLSNVFTLTKIDLISVPQPMAGLSNSNSVITGPWKNGRYNCEIVKAVSIITEFDCIIIWHSLFKYISFLFIFLYLTEITFCSFEYPEGYAEVSMSNETNKRVCSLKQKFKRCTLVSDS